MHKFHVAESPISDNKNSRAVLAFVSIKKYLLSGECLDLSRTMVSSLDLLDTFMTRESRKGYKADG